MTLYAVGLTHRMEMEMAKTFAVLLAAWLSVAPVAAEEKRACVKGDFVTIFLLTSSVMLILNGIVSYGKFVKKKEAEAEAAKAKQPQPQTPACQL